MPAVDGAGGNAQTPQQTPYRWARRESPKVVANWPAVSRISAMVGGVLWVALAGRALAGTIAPGGVALALLLAVAVVVPLGVPLIAAPDGGDDRARLPAVAVALQPGAAALAAVALALPSGPVAGLFALPWLGLTVVLALWGLARFWPRRFARAEEVALDAALAALPVGGFWLVCSRAGLGPGGFDEPIVSLTAAHFHYAGFGALALAGLAGRALPPGRPIARSLYRAAVAGTIGGIPLVALGISDLLPEPPGAFLLAASLALLSGLAATLVPRLARSPARALLAVSAVAPLAPLALACAYTLRETFPALGLTIGQMVRYHGLTNALGFVLCGLLAWTIEHRAAR